MNISKRTIITGTFWNWMLFGVNATIMFLFSPYFVHSLGDSRYGIWSVAVSLTGYCGLLDLGLRNTLVRYISKHHAAREHEELNNVVNASFFIFFLAGTFILIATVIVSLFLPCFFKIEETLLYEARWTVMILGGGLAVQFPLNALSGILVGLQRYDITAKISLCIAILFGVVNFVLLWLGYNLIALSISGAVSGVLSFGSMAWIGVRLLPELSLKFMVPSRQVVKKIFSFSAFVFLIGLAGRIFSYTNPVIIGSSISLAAVVFFTIPTTLITYAVNLINSFSRVLQPYASATQAKGATGELLSMTLWSIQCGIMFYVPLYVIIVCFGADFLFIWMGPEYANHGEIILWIMATANIFLIAEMSLENILMGMGHVRFLAIALLIEALLSVMIVMLLIQNFGLNGVAVGVAIPMILNRGIIIPVAGGRRIQFSYLSYLGRGILKPFVVGIPPLILSICLHAYFPPRNYIMLITYCTLVAVSYYFLQLLTSVEVKQLTREILARLRNLSPVEGKN